jgi:hypothetical protein
MASTPGHQRKRVGRRLMLSGIGDRPISLSWVEQVTVSAAFIRSNLRPVNATDD